MPEKTYDLTAVLCVFLVDLEESTAKVCTEVLDPIRAIRANASNAAVDILAMRPLLVIVSTKLDPGHQTKLQEAASACGAEMVSLDPMEVRADDPRLGVTLFETIRRVEKRRILR